MKLIALRIDSSALSAGGFGPSCAIAGPPNTDAIRSATRIFFIGSLFLLAGLLRDHAEVGLDHVTVLTADRLALRLNEVERELRLQLAPVAGLAQGVGRKLALRARAGLTGGASASTRCTRHGFV